MQSTESQGTAAFTALTQTPSALLPGLSTILLVFMGPELITCQVLTNHFLKRVNILKHLQQFSLEGNAECHFQAEHAAVLLSRKVILGQI